MMNAAILCLAGLWGVGQTSSIGSVKAAVVNIPEVSDKYARRADLEVQFEELRRKFQQERDALKDKAEKAARSLQEELKPGTDEYRNRRKQVQFMEAELQWFVEAETQKIEEGLGHSLQSIFRDIQAAVKEVADEQGIDIVLAADVLPEDAGGNPTQVRQQILLQKVLYWKPQVDLTSAVIERLNRKHEAKGRATPSQPPATEGGKKPK